MKRFGAFDPRRALARLPFRARLAAAFSSLFLLAGAALLAFVVILARHGTAEQLVGIETRRLPVDTPVDGASPVAPPPGTFGRVQEGGPTPRVHGGVALRKVETTVQAVQDAALHQMLLWSGVGLVVMALFAGLIGWWLAGRALRPVAAVTETARRIGETNLDERLALTGPDDELRRLADTIDTMLDRLQRAFDSQRRFVANASHELRTPLAAQRTSIEVGLADPLPGHLAEVRDDLMTTNREAERLTASLLLLARSDRGLDGTEPVDLADITATAAAELRPAVEEKRLELRTSIAGPLQLAGDPVLLRHLVANLVRNAIQYNRPRGLIEVTVADRTLEVTNTGRPVDPDQLDDLFEPFRRLGQDRVGTTGHGLGLSIVRSIAQAHGSDVRAVPGPDGGLTVTVRFP
ncbi:ATP-binding protein [Streptomyces sp. DSM 41524]|uniref:histidine kinase n=1 Tax=Streptomyces asiaticus subsp. ignotus TaxID=3098222 RepID=A0ABU7QBI5_9ACTN|nr:ATP-binding protein [Streptomyces sp. DSM 41524]